MAVAVVVLCGAGGPAIGVSLWLAAMWTAVAFNARSTWRSQHEKSTVDNAAFRLRASCRVEGLYGVLWMLAEVIILPGSDYAHRALMLVLISGLTAGVIQSLSAHLPALFLFTLPLVLGFVLGTQFHNGPYFYAALSLLMIWLTVNLNIARLMNRTLVESLQNHHGASALAADLQVQRDSAVKLSRMRSNFLAAASHDLRQPVHALSLLVGALKQSPSVEHSRELLGHVGSAVDAMSAMFNSLLDISKLDAGLLQPHWQWVDLQPLLARLALDQGLAASAKGLSFHCDTPVNVGMRVRTDPILLERVLRNLLTNAIRYTVSGSVRLTGRVRHGRVEISIADTGVGIARHRRAEAFEDFTQLHEPEGHAEQGLGLGLAIVQRLSGLLELKLRLRSRPGFGTIFTLHLPLVERRVATNPVAGSPSIQTQDRRVPSGLNTGDVVIVLDASAEIQRAMGALLSAWGYRVFAAASVRELLPQVMHLQAAPRLLLSDLRLRDGDDGIAAIAELRDAFNSDLPALLVTGETAPERLRLALASQLPLLQKPVTQQQLLEAIQQAVPLEAPAF